ncbi:MAG: polyprenyl synthetase family protein [Candidatus Diapherotrites archaeon]|nr:polyprenyl synthetase family protein [Candidatus Diapherotrites archaeon]
MGLEEFLKKNSVETDKSIEDFFPRRISQKWLVEYFGEPDFGFDLETLQKSLVDPMWDFLDRGGKRWRPALMVLCCEAVGGERKQALELTPIPELLHSGTIVVDDIEDGTELRRGKPAMHKLFGSDIAINNGMMLYYLPMVLVAKSGYLSLGGKNRLYGIYVDEMLKLSFGQGMDIFWHGGGKKTVSEENYLQMCSFKTGTLARLSAKFGAVIGGADGKTVKLLGDFANTIGVAFQIRDDILNLSEDRAIGKEFAEDIHEGKRTLMVIHALNNSSTQDANRLLGIVSSRTNDDSLKREAISIMKNAGSMDYASEMAETLVKVAWKKVDKAISGSKAKSLLCEFADYLVERKI